MKYFIYYSASGNGDFIAEKLKEKGYEPLKVEMVKPIKKIWIPRWKKQKGKD